MSGEYSLKELLEKYLDAYNLRPRFNEKEIKQKWTGWVGEKLASHTRSIEWVEGKLFVKTDNSLARQELLFMRSRLIEVINRHFGRKIIDDIKIL